MFPQFISDKINFYIWKKWKSNINKCNKEYFNNLCPGLPGDVGFPKNDLLIYKGGGTPNSLGGIPIKLYNYRPLRDHENYYTYSKIQNINFKLVADLPKNYF
tara:strand:- start:1838 stop:2143 length:306 start_codon:yes stop_codon:yes gene_type:complete